MIIHIYGSSSFRKEIHAVLEHANIKFRLDDHGEIKELYTLDELKNAIEEDPNNIYLIDDSKIIKKNSLNQKISFLKPKDGIEQEYLLDNGIGDISVDSIDELAKHIIKRLESVIPNNNENIEESIIDIVEEAYELDEDAHQLDDELSALLAPNADLEESEEVNEADTLDLVELVDDSLDDEINDSLLEVKVDKNDDELALEEFTKDPNDEFCSSFNFEQDLGNFDLDDEDEKKDDKIEDGIPEFNEEDFFSKDLMEETVEILEKSEEIEPEETVEIKIDEPTQGGNMADEFAEFDTLNESDILAALDSLGEVSINNIPKTQELTTSPVSKEKESLNISSSNVNDISELITKLLNNKTLEITIKVKD